MKKLNDPFIALIKTSFSRMEKKYPGYSWRRLSKKIGISHVFLLQILKGIRKFPSERLDNLISALEMDDYSINQLVQAYLEGYLKSIQESSHAISNYINQNKNVGQSHLYQTIFDELPLNKINIFKPWYNAALFDLIETKDFQPNSKWIAHRLSITEQQADMAFSFLKGEKLIELNSDGIWCKSQKKVRIPSSKPAPIMNEFYNDMFYRSSALMRKPYKEEDYQKRLILGLTCSINTENWKPVKLKLAEQLLLNAEELSDGNCDEVYYLMTMAIPLSKK